MTDLNGATVLLTGASGGFGREFIRQLLAAGSRLILTDRDEQAMKDCLPNEIAPGEIIATLATDLSSSAGCQVLYDRVKALDCPIDVLINNAGIAVFGRADEVPADKAEELMQLNLLTPIRLCGLFVPEMIDRNQGHIVNISSVAGWSAPGGLSHYAASKFGLRGFSEGLLDELREHQVKVTAVYPYFSRTPILRSPRYGSLAQSVPGFPESEATDPVMVIGNVLQGIVENKPQVFPDRTARAIHLLKRFSPSLLNWLASQLSQKISRAPES
ncbi:SDR family NAD(P)-dependent oxidoreductase [Roseofilum casamattae]|uniref:SDR family NAD(P)-dependent oxidoreductase n=1 Tax=Roseofilum casamattae BLCC-M143 TaxID=3022442 RepID=A0ABT7BTE5_9CYAN|nr:SDR family NAD(P)-dependent oxidoreductase [Roseofilum casamattae]MDJ1182456.1 SDR family NAD(P)-dependent oxidoreductase [Roseofilum casamattae BLCC-M143]